LTRLAVRSHQNPFGLSLSKPLVPIIRNLSKVKLDANGSGWARMTTSIVVRLRD
jgi:hypothetical protein